MTGTVPIKAGLKLLPDTFHTDIITGIVNHLMRGQDIGKQLDYLEGKRICLAISDTGNSFHIRITDRRLVRSSSHLAWDVRITGKLENFWRLANRSEDPDTLFFNRDLELEGDTDAALYLKNMLDALEFDLDNHLQEIVGTRLSPFLRQIIEHNSLARCAKKLVQIYT